MGKTGPGYWIRLAQDSEKVWTRVVGKSGPGQGE